MFPTIGLRRPITILALRIPVQSDCAIMLFLFAINADEVRATIRAIRIVFARIALARIVWGRLLRKVLFNFFARRCYCRGGRWSRGRSLRTSCGPMSTSCGPISGGWLTSGRCYFSFRISTGGNGGGRSWFVGNRWTSG